MPWMGEGEGGGDFGNFSTASGRKGDDEGEGVVSKPVDGARGFGLRSVYRRLFFALRSLRSPR